MKKHKIFTSLQDEEQWINDMQAQGYRLTKVNPFLCSYQFQPSTSPESAIVRLDFHEYFTKEAYQEYLTLFTDSGWLHVAGSRYSGTQYFLKTEKAKEDVIFSDEESTKAFYKRYQHYCYTYFTIFLVFYISQTTTARQHGYQLLNPTSWFLTPGLWERQGYHFWASFLFELPFALLRSGFIPYSFLALAIFYLQIAHKSKS